MFNLKEYEKIRSEKDALEFLEWFTKYAHHAVKIGGITYPCVRLTQKKVALSDASIFVCSDENDLHYMDDAEKWKIQSRAKMMEDYEDLEIEDQFSLKEYLHLLREKSERMRAIKRREELPEGSVVCAFCGKTKDQVRKMIAGPGNVCICDECVDVCSDILEEEFADDDTEELVEGEE